MNYRVVGNVKFPEFSGIKVNMMPIIMGDLSTVPENLRKYSSFIEKCEFSPGDTVYLSIHESIVEEGQTQRRPGIHTEGTASGGWGGGSGCWGRGGLYMASSDGSCRIWDCQDLEGDHMGAVSEPSAENFKARANEMYWITDRTPHEAVPVARTGPRQWFRLVGPDVFGWFTQHNTPNPLGVLPNAPLVHFNKFEKRS